MSLTVMSPIRSIGDGRWVLPASPQKVVVHGDWLIAALPTYRATVAVVDLLGGDIVSTAEHNPYAMCAAGKRPVVFLASGSRIVGLRLPTLRKAFDFEGGDTIVHLAVDDEGRALLVAEEKSTYIVEVESGKVRKLRGHPPTMSVHMSRDGALAVTFGRPYSARLHDTQKGKVLREIPGRGFAYSPFVLPGGRLVTMSDDMLTCLDLSTGKTTWIHHPIRAGAAVDSGRRLVVLRDEGHYYSVDAATGKPCASLAPIAAPDPLRLLECNEHLVSWSATGRAVAVTQNHIRILDADATMVSPEPQPHAGPVRGLFPTEKGLVSVGGSTVRRWDRAMDRSVILRNDLPLPTAYLGGMDHAHGVLAWQTRVSLIAHLEDAHRPLVLVKESKWVPADLKVHPTELWLLRVGSGNIIRRMAMDGTLGPSHTLGKVELECAVFASKSHLVVAGDQGGFVLDVKGWRGRGGGEIETLFEFQAADGIGCLARLSDTTVVATAKSGAVEIWDCATGARQTIRRAGKSAGYHAAAVRGDGRFLALAGGKFPGGVEVWDLGKGILSATFGEDHDSATAVAFVGKTFIVGTVRGRLLLFET